MHGNVPKCRPVDSGKRLISPARKRFVCTGFPTLVLIKYRILSSDNRSSLCGKRIENSFGYEADLTHEGWGYAVHLNIQMESICKLVD